jgi:starch-binding outer membrane protein, SusD/RagB family
MKMKSKIIISVFLIVGLFAGCEKMLEPGLDNSYGNERLTKDPAFVEGLLTAAYLRKPSNITFEEVGTDDAVTNDKANAFLRMASGEWSSQYNPISNWASAYSALYSLNYFLPIVDQVEWSHLSPKRNEYFKRRFKGEALALRGYFYSYLLINFGGTTANDELMGVPLLTKALGIEDEWRIPRNSYQECLDQILADFNGALELLPDLYVNLPDSADWNKVFGAQNANRINGQIVKALISRITLHAASPALNGGNYNPQLIELAANKTGELLAFKNGLANFPNDGILFYDADNDINNADILWRSNHSNSNTLEANNYPPSLYGRGRINPTQNLVDAFPMRNGYPIEAAGSGYLSDNPYLNRDRRLAWYILTNGATMRSTIINTAVDSPTNDGLNKVDNFSTRTGYYLLKFLRTNINMNPVSPGTARHFYAHIRWTEMYLNYAEAANEAWGPDGSGTFGYSARQVMAAIRNRAGVTGADAYLASLTSKEQMRELIRNERRLELCFEGFRFWDLRRWGKNLSETAKGISIQNGVYTPIDVENRVYPSHAVFGPIPSSEILKYPGLLQNEGW